MLIFAHEIQTSTKMKMKKTIISFALMLFAISASAQSTARKFVLKNSTDGQSELTCYLPKKPMGRAVVDCPGGGYSHLTNVLCISILPVDMDGDSAIRLRVSVIMSRCWMTLLPGFSIFR